jgi:NitT/TauT family transport system ATP-binding protein
VISARPGTVKRDIAIDLPRPRDPAQLRREKRFAEYIDEIWSALDRPEDVA